MKLYYNLFGYRRVSFALEDSADVLNLCMKYRYPYRDMQTDNGRVSFVCTLFSASRITLRASEMNIDVTCESIRGMPAAFLKLFEHPGLIAGFFLACLIVLVSRNYVWDVRVTGNERFTAEEIENALAESGFSVGSSLRSFDADRTELRCLIANPELAWISVNLRGNVAYVEVREKLVTEPQIQGGKTANIVASHSGKIIEIVAYNGVPSVKAGDEVREGELLISGAYGDKTPGLRVTRAAGYVLARTVRTFSVEIPYAYDKKVYSGEEEKEIFMFFFKKAVKVFGNSGNLGSSCDKIEEEKNITLFGERLPVSFAVNLSLPYTFESAEYTVEEARSLANAQLEALIKEALPDAKIILRKDSFLPGEASVRVECEIICIENIALVKEFETEYK